MNTLSGRVRRFGDNIDTDMITPGSTLQLNIEEMKKHAFSPIFPDFFQTVRDGDIIVAGSNFGCGSSREQATAVVKELGIRIIVAESVARIYFRNCIALGIYPILCSGVSALFREGDTIQVAFEQGLVRNPNTGKSALFKPLSGTPKEILEGGGILARLKDICESARHH